METSINPKHPTHAARIVDNSDGEGDVVTIFVIERDGKFFSYDSGSPLLGYKGDRIIKIWPLSI